MKHLAAYALLVLGGKENPSEEEILAVLKEVGAQGDKEQLKILMTALKGKKLHEVIAAGMSKIQTLAVAAPAAPASADTKGKPEAKKEAKKEEKKEEEEALAGGLGDIFG